MVRARATAMAMADGNATERAAAMVNGNHNGNGQRQRQWATATVMVMESARTTEMATAIAMATAMAMATITKEGLPLYVAAMCSAFGGATPCLHPMDTNESACVMGVTLLRVFAPLQGGGFLTAHHGLFFCLFFTTTVQFTEQPSVRPPTLFRRSRTLSDD